MRPGPTCTREDVSRVLARTAFGATEEDLDTWTGQPYGDLVDWLLAPTGPALPTLPEVVGQALAEVSTGLVAGSDAVQADLARRTWLGRMQAAPHPLREKLTLVWHDHFATGISGDLPDAGQVLDQIELLRTHALGDLRALLGAITLDPAMLHWLDGASSAPPFANENYAREFLELFTLGRAPQVYTERDVREAARAFTGWVVQPQVRLVQFDPARHDAGTKTVLGRRIVDRGDLEYLDVVDAALAQPVASLFLADRLVRGLGWSTGSTDLLRRPDPVTRRVARVLRTSGFQVAPAVRALLLSPEYRFAGERRTRRYVRTPAEVVVGTARALGVTADDEGFLPLMVRMGQVLLQPPNVGGWPEGTSWLSPPSVLARYDVGLLAASRAESTTLVRPLPAPDDLAAWAARFGLPRLSASTTRALRTALAATGGDEVAGRAGVAALLATCPEWTVV